MKQLRDRKQSPREASVPSSSGAKGGGSAKLKENIPTSKSPVSTRKYAGHSGIKFHAKLKETAKGVSLDARTETDKENPDCDASPSKSDDIRKDEKSAPASKEIKTKTVERLQLLRERGEGPRTRSVTREMLSAAPLSKIPKEGKSSVLSSKAAKPSNILELPSASNTLPPIKPYSGHTGMKFLMKPKNQTVVKPFSMGKKSSDVNPSTASIEEPEKIKDDMEYVPKKITKRRNAVDLSG